MSDKFIDFLRARLDDDEWIARAATPGHDSWHSTRMGSVTSSAVYDDQWRLVSAPLYHTYQPSGGAVTNGPAYLRDDVLSEHIARHDPARALREVEAKRRILEEHTPALTNSSCRICTTREEGVDRQSRRYRFPCPTIRLLALPYSDHPDYRDEWRP